MTEEVIEAPAPVQEQMPSASSLLKSEWDTATQTANPYIENKSEPEVQKDKNKQGEPDNQEGNKVVQKVEDGLQSENVKQKKEQAANPDDDIAEDFVKSTKKQPAKSIPDFTPSSLDEISERIKTKFGVDKWESFEKSVSEWRKGAQNQKTALTELETLKSELQSLPKEVKLAIDAARKNGDYRSAFTSAISSIDYELGFEKQDLQKLAKEYKPGINIDDPERTDYVDLSDKHNAAVSVLTDFLKEKFESNKQSFLEKSTKDAAKQEEFNISFLASAKTSIENLKESLPVTIKQPQEKYISDVMNSGDLSDVFFDENEHFKPTAAKSLFYAKYGEGIVSRLLRELQEAQSIQEEIISKGSDKPKAFQNNSRNQAPMSELQNEWNQASSKSGF